MNKKRTDTGKNDIFRQCRRFHENFNDENHRQQALSLLAWYIEEHGDINRFNLEVKELFNSHRKEGFYSWNGLVYFLYEYENSIRGKEDKRINYQAASRRSDSIEHILPRETKDTAWTKIVDSLDHEKKKRVLHSIGNLVMIKASKNSSIRNFDFDTKKERFINGSFSENEIASKNEIWDIATIENREEKLISFLKDRWGINNDYLKKYPGAKEINDDYDEEDNFVEE